MTSVLSGCHNGESPWQPNAVNPGNGIICSFSIIIFWPHILFIRCNKQSVLATGRSDKHKNNYARTMSRKVWCNESYRT